MGGVVAAERRLSFLLALTGSVSGRISASLGAAERTVGREWAPRMLPQFELRKLDGSMVDSRSWEYHDQLLIFRHVRPDDSVLMVGGNIGGACIAVDKVVAMWYEPFACWHGASLALQCAAACQRAAMYPARQFLIP